MLNSNYEEQAKKILQKWNYQTIRKIGKGGFGHVVLASRFTNFMVYYAIKCISLRNSSKDPNIKKYIEQQARIMNEINHANVVHFQSSFQDAGWYFIVMEYCELGNLTNYQFKNANKIFELGEACKILMQVMWGLQAIHQRNIIHKDIKCDNILLKKNKNGQGYLCKIGDFGFAEAIQNKAKSICGTTLFMAPEVLKNTPYGFQADIWSIGVIFYFMLFGAYPFKSSNIENDIKQKCMNGFSLANINHSLKDKKQFSLIQDLFKQIFELNQQKRIKLQQILNHELFKMLDGEGTQDSFSTEQAQQELEWCFGKVMFTGGLIADLEYLMFLDPFLLHSVKFYLYKVNICILNHEKIQSIMADLPRNQYSVKIKQKLEQTYQALQNQYYILKQHVGQTTKITKFQVGYNLSHQQFSGIKQPYRNTLALLYTQIHKRISNKQLKTQLKFRVLCCNLINRIFDKGFTKQIFPNFTAWSKLKYRQKQKQKNKMDRKQKNGSKFQIFNQWICEESAPQLMVEIQNVNSKFY